MAALRVIEERDRARKEVEEMEVAIEKLQKASEDIAAQPRSLVITKEQAMEAPSEAEEAAVTCYGEDGLEGFGFRAVPIETCERIACERDEARTERDEVLEALGSLLSVVGLTPIAGNKEALQEAFDQGLAVRRKLEAAKAVSEPVRVRRSM